MRKDDLVKGRRYALRPQGSPVDDPFVKVTFVGPVRSRQARVRYESGELQGLEEWVQTRLLACPWGERKELLRDEERAAHVDAAGNAVWDALTRCQ